jgi:hypothetical protein
MKRFIATAALCVSAATVAFGTVLTFDNAGGFVIPTDYGSRVTTQATTQADERASISPTARRRMSPCRCSLPTIRAALGTS